MKRNQEFDKFTGFMDKLAKVPHSELKATLDAEKAEKKGQQKAQDKQVKAPPKIDHAKNVGEAFRKAGRMLRDNPKLQVPY